MQRTARSISTLFDIRRHLTFTGLILRDTLGIGGPRLGGGGALPNDLHLRAAMEWLCRAQDVAGAGVSGGYSWLDGWLPPYPETTGYIIPTFIAYAAFTGDGGYVDRAVRMGEWELSVQMPSGAIPGGIGLNNYPIVFNTGQVILGWTALHRKTQEARYLDAARSAAAWLVSVQEADGRWCRYDFHDVPHVYSTRVAWPMLEVWELTRDDVLRIAVERHIEWVLGQTNERGWFKYMAFTPEAIPYTHTIAYTLRGLIECAFRLEGPICERIWAAVTKACESILLYYERRKRDPRGWPAMLPGRLDGNWRSTDRYSCLTGNVQVANVMIRLYERGGDVRYLNAALKLIDQTKATQPMHTSNPSIRGAVAGSYPIWGGYIRFGFPNWAAKFLADAIMMADAAMAKLESDA